MRCCARAVSGQAVAEPTIPLMKSRRRIAFAQGLGPRQFSFGLQQGFPTDEMGVSDQVAWQQFRAVDVRFGSKADIASGPRHVRFTLESRRQKWLGSRPA